MRTLVLIASLAVCSFAQVASQANNGYRTAEARANIARRLDDPHRDRTQRPKELVEALRLKPGMTVADLGTGVGYLLPWLSRAVGPKGRVIAQDIFPDFLEKARERGKERVAFVLGTERDSKLPAGCCDLVLTLDAYHHFDYPGDVLASVARALRPGGRFVIVDFYKRAGAMPNGDAVNHIRLDVDDVVREVGSFGWKLIERSEHNPGSQYIAVFRKR